MAVRVEATEIASHEPAVHHSFGGEFRFIEVARHHGFAAHGDFADTVGIRIKDADLHARKRFADGVCTERFQIVDGDARARFGETVSICYGDPKIVEEPKNLWLSESAPNNDGAKLATERFVNLSQ